jgi:hypothetical protein
MRYTSRNDTLGFAFRTRKNLNYVVDAYARGEDVHVVTQLAMSLLGLIVYPKERQLVKRVESLKLRDLEADGWPRWNIEAGHSETLGEFMRMLRNAIAHGHVLFSSEGREMEDVAIVFENHTKFSEVTWRASIDSLGLKIFCDRFIRLIEDVVG